LWLDGRELTGLPLLRRKEILRSIIPEEGIVRVSEIFDDPVKDFFEAARRMNLEGIVVKNAQSEYYPGARSREWLKLKAAKRQEVVIGGYTINENSGKRFSSVLVGVYENGALH